MAISLKKGQRIDLTKGNTSISQIMVGLGWDPISQPKKGFFSSSKVMDVDCDASVIMLQNDHLINNKDLIYFGNKSSKCQSVIHSGDNTTGEGDGDDESIKVDLKSIPKDYNKLVFVVNIYDCIKRKQDFGMIQNAYIRVTNVQTQEELVRYNLSENYSGLTALVTGEIYRHDGEWKFAAVGDGTKDSNLTEVCRRYQ
jgi:stress response protein SCP2